MIRSVWKHGIRLLCEDDVGKKRRDASAQRKRKTRVNCTMAASMVDGRIVTKYQDQPDVDVEQQICTKSIMRLFPHFYI